MDPNNSSKAVVPRKGTVASIGLMPATGLRVESFFRSIAFLSTFHDYAFS